MDAEPGQRADDGAVDPDELQVAAHVQLDALGRLLAVPAVDRHRDDLGELAAVGVDEERHHLAEPRLEPPPPHLVLDQVPPEVLEQLVAAGVEVRASRRPWRS